MNNLYKINFEHFSQKDSQVGILAYLVAKNDEEVYEWIKSEPSLNNDMLFNSWKYYEEGSEEFKTKIIECNGRMYDEDYYPEDLYYGATEYGWDLLKEGISDEEIKVLNNVGIELYTI